MTCQTCMWYAPKKSADGNVYIGRCRKNAPEISGYPAVFPGDWCGQHKLDENSLIPQTILTSTFEVTTGKKGK